MHNVRDTFRKKNTDIENCKNRLVVVAHTFNLNILEAKAG